MRASVWVWEQLIDGQWWPWEDKENGGLLTVHATARYVRQPEPHTPQYGKFRWTEYVASPAKQDDKGAK